MALFLVGAVAGLLVGAAPPSGAHAELLKTEPASGASLDRAPSEVRLEFGESVRIPNGGVRVVNESADRLATSSPRSTDSGRTQTIALPGLKNGAYVVSWRAVSADGHPIRGAFTFRVGRGGDQAALARLAEKLLGSGGGPTGPGIALAFARFLSFLSMIVLIGGIGYLRFVRRGRPGRRGRTGRSTLHLADSRTLVLTRIATVICALSGIAAVILYGPYVGGYGFAAITDATVLDDTLADPVGRALLARTATLVILGFVLMKLFRTNEPSKDDGRADVWGRALLSGGAVLAVLALVAQVFTGHGNTGPHKTLGALFTVVHVGSTSLWIGGLTFVVIGTVGADITAADADTALRRFSPLAFAAVTGMVVSGAFASWRQVGSVQAARETTYGQLLLVKLALVVGLLLLGGMARRMLRSGTKTPSTGPTTGTDAITSTTVRRRLVVEVAMGVAVIGVTALLVNVAPAREAVARPVALRLSTTTLTIDMTIDPARKGRNSIHMYALTKTGAQQAIDHAALSASLPGSGIEPIELKVLRAGPNHFQVLNADLPVRGTWTFDVAVGVDQFTEERVTAQVTLR